MDSVNTIDLVIDEKALGYARIYASLLSDEYQRKRAYASIAALYAFINLAEKSALKVQKSMTLFRNPILNEQYEISDVYINNRHIDVRIITGGDAVLVPKIHYDNDIVPDFYVVVKTDTSLKTAELVGIADTSACEKEAFDYHYNSISLNSLISYEEFLKRVQTEKQLNFSDSEHDLFKEKYLGLLDNSLDISTKNKIIKHLFECPECRTEFCCFTGFEMVCCNVPKYPDLLDDQTLNIIGAQNTEDKKYEGKEEVINISDDIKEDDTKDKDGSSIEENKEETVSDILDELFSIDEDFIESADSNKDKPVDSQLIQHENIAEDNDALNTEIVSEDLQIINDDKEDIEIIEENIPDVMKEMPVVEEDEMQIIYEGENSELAKNNELDIKEPDTIEELNDDSDFVLIDHKDDNDLITEIESDNLVSDMEIAHKKENVQKVIVDYDENGEPIYSYITNVEQNEEEETIDFETEPVSEQEKIEELPEYSEEANSDSEIKNIDDYPNNESLDNIDSKDLIQEDNLYHEEQNGKDEEITGTKISEQEDTKEYISNGDIELEEDITTEDENETQISDESEETSDIDESSEFEEDSEEGGEYDDYDIEDVLPEENVQKSSSKIILAVISLLVIIGLIGGGAFFLLKNNNKTASSAESNVSGDNNAIEIPNNQETNDMFEQPVSDEINIPMENNKTDNSAEENQSRTEENNNEGNDFPLQGSIPVPPLTEGDLVQTPKSHGDVNKAIANAFSQNGGAASFRGLNWFCTSELFSDSSFKNYLQDLDNKLKQNLKNNILNSTETPPNDSVTAKFAVDNNGNLQKVIISDSSGSGEIDNIVLQSINESFEGEKSQILNDSTLKADMYYLKVVIKL